MARIPTITILTLLLAAGPAEAVRAEAAPRTIDYLAAVLAPAGITGEC